MIRERMNTASLDFNTLHDQFRPRVLRYVTQLVGETEAEDVAQSVMLKVNEGLSGFRGDSSVSTWIYRIATNVALDKLRQKAIQRSPTQ
jgi:RNA polymerase sigma-70 factor (ECF subfamily)